MPAKLTKDDEILLRYAVENHIFTPTELAAHSGRSLDVISRRLRLLGYKGRIRNGKLIDGLRFLKSTLPPFSRYGEDIWYPMQPAFDYALEEGWIEQPMKATDREGSTRLQHDLRLRDYRLHLGRQYGAKIRGTLQHYNLYENWGKEDHEHIFADWFFYLDQGERFPCAFVEEERTHEAKYNAKTYSARVTKAVAYLHFFARGLFQEKFRSSDFRVIFRMTTRQKALNLAAKLHQLGDSIGDLRSIGETLNTRKFWMTDFESTLSGEERIYVTPKDYETRAYSLNEL